MGMGGGFWDVVKPVCCRSDDLSWLRGKRLAVDLSFWIVQQESVLKGRARKPHLRLTFFRVVNLIAKVGALPIFVVDGEAPLLKLPVRIERFSRVSGIPVPQRATLDGISNHRNQAFTDSVEECVVLLKLLGIPVLRAKGEAEALCAELEQYGIVDACVTSDGDAFLHGATCVIQTLQADYRDPLTESYFASDIKSVLGLGRQHLVALALLVGCDYNTRGIPGIGYSRAIRLVRYFPENAILDHLRRWGRGQHPSPEEIESISSSGLESESDDDKAENTARKDSHCSMCGHLGSKRVHTKRGCDPCGTENIVQGCIQKAKDFKCTCGSCRNGQRRKKHTKDLTWWSDICAKISAISNFPNEQIIDLFLNLPGGSHLAGGQNLLSDSQWQVPKMELLEPFLAEHLHWDLAYIRQKTLPLLSHFCLESMAEGSSIRLINGKYAPDSIQRIKIQRGKPLYVVKWKQVKGSLDKDWLCLNSAVKRAKPGTLFEADEEFFTTDEEISVVEKACPNLVQKFELQQSAKKKVSRRKKKEAQTPCNQKSIMSFFKPKAELREATDQELIVLDEESISPSSGKRSMDVKLGDESELALRASVRRRLFQS